MADYAALVYDIDSSSARTAATDLAKMNNVVVEAVKRQEGLDRAIRDSSGRFQSSAVVANKYGKEVYDLASKYNLALKAVYDFQAAEAELSRAVALGVITKKQSVEILARMQESARKSALGFANASGSARLFTSALNGLTNAAKSTIGRLSILATTALSLRTITSTLSGFEKSMASVQAVTMATTEDMRAMREMAKDLGATTEFTASQAAEGLRFLGMAGFSTRESLEAIPAVLDLATSATMDLGSAADITSNIMSAFGIAARDAADIADVLAVAASSANTDVKQMGDGMKFVGPVASAMGISINDAAAAIGVLSNAGIQGGMAGTGLRRVLSSLANTTPKAEKTLARLGITLDQVNPAANDLTDIVNTLAAAGLNASDALTIFGDRGGPAILALTENSGELVKLTDSIQDVNGAAADMAGIMRDNLAGDFDILKASAEGVIIALGEAGVTDVLRALVKGTAALLTGVGNVVDVIGKLTSNGKALGSVLAILAATRVPALTAGVMSMSSGMLAAAAGTRAVTVASIANTSAIGAQTVAVRGLGIALAAIGGVPGLVAAGVASIGVALVAATSRSSQFKNAQVDSFNAAQQATLRLSEAYNSLDSSYATFVDRAGKHTAEELKRASDVALASNNERNRRLLAQLSILNDQADAARKLASHTVYTREQEEQRRQALIDLDLINKSIEATEASIALNASEHLSIVSKTGEAIRFINDLEQERLERYGDMNEEQREAYDDALKTQEVFQRRVDLMGVAVQHGKDSLQYAKLQIEQERQIELSKLEALKAQADGNEEAEKAVNLAIEVVNQTYDAVIQTENWERSQSAVNDRLRVTQQLLANISGTAINVAAIRVEKEALQAGASLREASLKAARETARLEGNLKTSQLKEQYGIWGKILGEAQAASKQLAISEAASLDTLKQSIAEQERADRRASGGGGGGKVAKRSEAELKSAIKGFNSIRQLMEEESLFQVAEWEKRQGQLDAALDKQLVTREKYLRLTSELQTMYFGTEYERQQLQYDMSLEQLTEHLEKMRITQEQYDAMSTSLKWEKYNQEVDLNRTKWSAELNGLSNHMGQLNQLAGSGYDGLLKAQKAFGAASAMISTYTGAAQVLADPKLGFFAKLAAVSKVVAAGMGLVSAIKGGGSSSGSGGSSSASSVQTSQEPTRTVLVRLSGDDFLVNMASEVMEQIYEESKDGRVIIQRDY